MFLDIYGFVQTLENEQYQLICIDCGVSNPMSSIGHDALDKRTNSFASISNHRSYCLDGFDQNAFIRPVNIRVIEARSI